MPTPPDSTVTYDRLVVLETTDPDADRLSEALLRSELRHVQLDAGQGFLRTSNVVTLVPVPAARVGEVQSIATSVARVRTGHLPVSVAVPPLGQGVATSTSVPVGGVSGTVIEVLLSARLPDLSRP